MANPIGTTFLVVAASAIGYCFYFDYQRRNNPEFRKSLYAQKKIALKKAKLEAEADKNNKLATLKAKLSQSLLLEPLPTGIAEKETYFMEQVGLGEKLAAIVGKEIDAAIHFYKALAIYPAPTSILEIYQKSIPKDIYELVMMLTAILPPASVASILGDSTASLQEEQD